MTLLSLAVVACLSASAAAPTAPQAIGTIGRKKVAAQFADRIRSAEEQAAQNADCPVLDANATKSCFWTGPEEDPRQWMLDGASFATLTIDLETRQLTYVRDLAGGERPGAHREARFVLDPVDIEGFALLPSSDGQLIRLPDELRQRLWALAQVAERRGEDVPRRGRLTQTR